MSQFHDFTVKDAKGQDFPLAQLKGKTVLVVNVASKCGFTKQYTGLESLYQQFKDRDFVILGFPCNQFGGQEPGTNDDIQRTCTVDWGVSFPVLAKVDVNGANAAPIYEFLKSSAPGILGTEAIKWNFTKFLIDGNGRVTERFAPQTEPQELISPISKMLG
ncbi:MAG: glutathione peroxidase [Bdellovibrionaceae bacterium]|nr:glutathione peroxidase [Pseudobdellovibrionaceae bacterium]